MGNCGLSLAPVQPGFGPRVTRMFNKIEDIDPEFFDAAVPYTWTSFGEYLDFIRHDLGVNVGANVGHSILRHFVMGDDAQKRPANDAEIAKMCDCLGEAIEAGAFGITMSYEHLTDENNRPMASAYSDVKERTALARRMVECGRHFIQISMDFTNLEHKLEQYDELADISLETGACMSALALMDLSVNRNQWKIELEKLDQLQQRGAKVYGQTMVRPIDYTFQLDKANTVFYLSRLWGDIMIKPIDERKRLLSDRGIWPDLHAALVEYFKGIDGHARVKPIRVYAEANKQYLDRTLKEIGDAEGVSSTEIMLRIALRDDLKTLFDFSGEVHGNVDVVSQIMDHPMVQIGGSDAGAHVKQFAGEGDSTYVLGYLVRDLRKFSLERAVQRMSGDLARDCGMARRGTIMPGNYADLAIFDPLTVNRGETILVHDLPGNGERFIRHSTGVDKTIVNGQIVFDNGSYTNVRPGRVV
jgi:N-acyl-D-amino-acid deacylase